MKRQLYTLSAINGTLPSQIQNRFGSKISMYIKLMENQLLWIIFFEKNENLAKTLLMPFLYPMRYSVPDGTIIWYHCNSYDESRRRSLKKVMGLITLTWKIGILPTNIVVPIYHILVPLVKGTTRN